MWILAGRILDKFHTWFPDRRKRECCCAPFFPPCYWSSPSGKCSECILRFLSTCIDTLRGFICHGRCRSRSYIGFQRCNCFFQRCSWLLGPVDRHFVTWNPSMSIISLPLQFLSIVVLLYQSLLILLLLKDVLSLVRVLSTKTSNYLLHFLIVERNDQF